MYQGELEKFNFPISIIWEITNQCVSNCIYCSGKFENKQDCRKELSKDEKYKLVRELIENHIFGVNLSGGEPFLSIDLEWIIDELTRNNIKVLIATSGLVYKERLIKKFAKNPLISYCISIDSFQSSINDFQRGYSNTLEKIFQFINKICVESEIPPYIQLECVLTKRNCNHIEEYLEKVSKYPISKVGFQPVIAMNEKTYDEGLNLSQQEIDVCRNKISQIKHQYTNMNIDLIEQYYNIEQCYQNRRSWGGIVTPEGDLLLSVYLPFIFANTRKCGGLKAIWKSKLSMGWVHPAIKEDVATIHNIHDLEKLQKKYDFQRVSLEEL
jgi:MoaA/NifB/PqqE/SkfB family radical SAM enzyme